MTKNPKKTKVGVVYGQIPAKMILRHITNGDFVSVVDGITFGVMEGRPFHSARADWPISDQVRWSRAQAVFFRNISENLDGYADATAKGLEGK